MIYPTPLNWHTRTEFFRHILSPNFSTISARNYITEYLDAGFELKNSVSSESMTHHGIVRLYDYDKENYSKSFIISIHHINQMVNIYNCFSPFIDLNFEELQVMLKARSVKLVTDQDLSILRNVVSRTLSGNLAFQLNFDNSLIIFSFCRSARKFNKQNCLKNLAFRIGRIFTNPINEIELFIEKKVVQAEKLIQRSIKINIVLDPLLNEAKKILNTIVELGLKSNPIEVCEYLDGSSKDVMMAVIACSSLPDYEMAISIGQKVKNYKVQIFIALMGMEGDRTDADKAMRIFENDNQFDVIILLKEVAYQYFFIYNQLKTGNVVERLLDEKIALHTRK